MTERQRLLTLMKDDPTLLSRLLFVADAPVLGRVIDSPQRAYSVLAPLVLGQDREHFAICGLDRWRRVVATEVLTVGNEDFCIVCPKQIFRWALTQKRAVSAVILAHNHPSGEATPSTQDIEVTRIVAEAGRVLRLPVLDHLVIGAADRWVSMANEGYVTNTTTYATMWVSDKGH